MKVSMIIPTYWGRPSYEGWKEGDAVYDHATPLDEWGTLKRTLDSLNILENKNFKLVILLCPTTKEVAESAAEKVIKIIQEAKLPLETYLFTLEQLHEMEKICLDHGLNRHSINLLSLKGYSNVRNMCLYTSFVLGSQVSVLIDDDEIIEDPKFMDIAMEFIGGKLYGKTIDGVAGYYLNRKNEYYDDVDIEPWMTFWNRFGYKTEAFDKIIGCEPRLKPTPFAFGGCMVIHKNLFRVVPFDPRITRGEDIDYLINAKMFGFHFFLDNKLNIKHLPPKKNHPVWKRLREDLYRFIYEKKKIESQYEVPNMHRVSPEDFDPYPGEFLKDDLEDKIFKANIMLGLDLLTKGDIEGAKETINNIYYSKYEAVPKDDVFTHLRQLQRQWKELLDFTNKHITEFRNIMETGNLSRESVMVKDAYYESVDREQMFQILREIPFFKELDPAEVEKIAEKCSMQIVGRNEYIKRIGDIDDALYIIKRGTVDIVKRDIDGDQVILARLEEGDYFGETCITNRNIYVDIIAEDVTELIVITEEDIYEIIENYPKTGTKLMLLITQMLSDKLNKSNILYMDTLAKDSELYNKI